jgi:hypothetical protein
MTSIELANRPLAYIIRGLLAITGHETDLIIYKFTNCTRYWVSCRSPE